MLNLGNMNQNKNQIGVYLLLLTNYRNISRESRMKYMDFLDTAHVWISVECQQQDEILETSI